MPDPNLPKNGKAAEEKLSADEAAALIKAIEDMEREEAEAADSKP